MDGVPASPMTPFNCATAVTGSVEKGMSKMVPPPESITLTLSPSTTTDAGTTTGVGAAVGAAVGALVGMTVTDGVGIAVGLLEAEVHAVNVSTIVAIATMLITPVKRLM